MRENAFEKKKNLSLKILFSEVTKKRRKATTVHN